MIIKNLILENFRNYEFLNFNPSDKFNVFLGKNAMGKTNLLESIYMITFGKSFRTNLDRDLIKLGKLNSTLSAKIDLFGYEDEARLNLNLFEKNKFEINEEEFSLKNYRKDFSSVLFYPDDLNLIKNSPSDRRKYFDILNTKISTDYEYNFLKYRKILLDRNKLLKYKLDKKLLEVYNNELAIYGIKLLRDRLKLLREFETLLKPHFNKLSAGSNISITYLSTIDFKDGLLEEKFLNELNNILYKDLEYKYTTIGPHRDDIEFKIDSLNAKNFASQGEIRTLVLSLKLAEIDLIKKYKKNPPILLLDDVFSEIDKRRSYYLVDSIKNIQCFITSTDLSMEIFKTIDGNFYQIDKGSIKNKLGEDNERK